MDVSIIIVAWNVRQLLEECLASVFEQTSGVTFEVIYVDNASVDGSSDTVRAKFPSVRIIQNDRNLGFIKANNQGIRVAQGRYILLLNSDTLVLDNAVAKIVRFGDEHPQAAVVGGRVLNPDETLQRSCLTFHSLTQIFLGATYLYKLFPRFASERITWWDYNEVRAVDVIVGCFSLVRRDAFATVGLMDEDYFVYCDDRDWCYRFRQAGWEVLFTPEPRIIHYGGQTTKKAADKFVLQLYGSRLQFMRKYNGPVVFLLSRFLTAFHFFIRAPFWFLKGIMSTGDRTRCLQTAGTFVRGGTYALFDWPRLLMNREELFGQDRTPSTLGDSLSNRSTRCR